MPEPKFKTSAPPRPRWAAWCLALVALALASPSARGGEPPTDPAKLNILCTTFFLEPTAAVQPARLLTTATAGGTILCFPGTLLNPCDVSCSMSFWMFVKPLGLWVELTDPHCGDDGVDCGDSTYLLATDEVDRLPVGLYELRVNFAYGTCTSPGANVTTLTVPFQIN